MTELRASYIHAREWRDGRWHNQRKASAFIVADDARDLWVDARRIKRALKVTPKDTTCEVQDDRLRITWDTTVRRGALSLKLIPGEVVRGKVIAAERCGCGQCACCDAAIREAVAWEGLRS